MDNANTLANAIQFEYPSENGNKNIEIHTSLTKREYFAGLAMQGLISGNFAWSDGATGGSAMVNHKDVARESVNYADALLEVLEAKDEK